MENTYAMMSDKRRSFDRYLTKNWAKLIIFRPKSNLYNLNDYEKS